MKRKLQIFTLSFLLIISSICFSTPLDYHVFADESSVSKSDNSSSNEDSASAGEILLIIGIFTVTAAASALITYKIRKNKTDKKDSDN